MTDQEKIAELVSMLSRARSIIDWYINEASIEEPIDEIDGLIEQVAL